LASFGDQHEADDQYLRRQAIDGGHRRLKSSAEHARHYFSRRAVAAIGKLKKSRFHTASVEAGISTGHP
jgi:hypothetical protein